MPFVPFGASLLLVAISATSSIALVASSDALATSGKKLVERIFRDPDVFSGKRHTSPKIDLGILRAK